MRVTGTFELSGDVRLLKYRPSTFTMTRFEAAVGAGRITVESVRPGVDQKPEQIKADLQGQIEKIRKMAEYANADVQTHNQGVEATVRRLVEQCQERVRKRRDLAGALGFPLTRRQNAPQPVPLERKRIGTARQHQGPTSPYKDEPALTDAQYEDAIAVVQSTLLAMERSPSVASGKSEEELRDQILVQLNGTFTGGATGETFVQKGKTDILVKGRRAPRLCGGVQMVEWLQGMLRGCRSAPGLHALAQREGRAHSLHRSQGRDNGDRQGR